MAVTQFKSFPFTSGVQYRKFDTLNQFSQYYYATQDVINEPPSAIYSYSATSFVRDNEKTTMYFTQTGAGPAFAQGSYVIINSNNTDTNYTGMVLNAQPNSIQYINPGLPTSNTVAGTVYAPISPAWSTGFYFIPSYTTNVDTKTNTIQSQFGDGYVQRQRAGLNSNVNTLNLVFDNRSDKETKAILNFIEDKGNVNSFPILMATTNIYNNPNQKYTAADPKLNTISYNLNTVSAAFTQNFDP